MASTLYESNGKRKDWGNVLREFNYSEKKRKVIALDEDETSVSGIDLSHLTEEEADNAVAAFNNLKVAQDAFDKVIEDSVKRCYRKFLKEKIN